MPAARREDNAYPEMEESFSLLRQAYEQAFQAGVDSLPMDRIGKLSYTAGMKKLLVPGVKARGLTRTARKP